MRPGLVIFDCDGVLVDTEAIYFEMNRRFVLSHKTSGPADFDLRYYERFIGLAADLMWGELKETFALRESVAELIATEKDLKAKALGAAPLVPLAGVSEFMADLAAAEDVRRLAQAANCSVGTLYNIFGDIDGLILAKETVAYSRNPSLADVLTAAMTIEVMVKSTKGESRKWSFTASGATLQRARGDCGDCGNRRAIGRVD